MRHLSLLAAALLLCNPVLGSDDVIRKGFNVSPGGTLRVSAGVGDITVVTGGTGVAVEIVREARGARGEKMMEGHHIDVRQSGDDVIIDGDLDRDMSGWLGSWGPSNYEVKWNVRVPARYNIDVRTSGGFIKLADIGGTVDARTSGGEITTGRLGGTASLATSGGDITVAGAANELVAKTSGGDIDIGNTDARVEAKTSGGSIRLARVGSSVIARTSGGDIDIEDAMGAVDAKTSGGSITAQLSRQPQGESRLSTSGGGVTVSIADGIGVELDARASGGGVDSDVPVTVQGTQERDQVRGRIGGGGPALVLRSSGGGIRVKRM
jgi:hypothetical protein